jgi:hypothetical protein
MTETPEGLGNPSSEPTLQGAAEPTPDVTRTPTAELTGSTSRIAESRSRWRWPEKTRNRIAVSVAIAAGAVAVVAAIFTSGVAVGAHAGGDGEPHVQWGRHSAASASREFRPFAQIWIIPGHETAGASDGFIVTGSESASMTMPR